MTLRFLQEHFVDTLLEPCFGLSVSGTRVGIPRLRSGWQCLHISHSSSTVGMADAVVRSFGAKTCASGWQV